MIRHMRVHVHGLAGRARQLSAGACTRRASCESGAIKTNMALLSYADAQATGVVLPRTHLRSISSCFCLALRVSSDIGTIVDLPGPLARALAVLLEDAPVAAHDAPLWSVQQLPQPAEKEAHSTPVRLCIRHGDRERAA